MSFRRCMLPSVVALFLQAGCAAPGESGPPAREPDVEGVITRVEPGDLALGVDRILVEADPRDEAGSPKMWLDLTPDTRVLVQSDGEYQPAMASDLRTGRRASGWAAGPIRESYPSQADAAAIVVR